VRPESALSGREIAMTDEKIRLYGEPRWISPYVFSTFVALTEKDVPFEVVTVSLDDGENRRPEYRDRSVTAKVPALEHRGFWLAESGAIAEYLEESFPPPHHARLFPEGLLARARARQVLHWIRSDLGALREERPTTSMFYARATKPLSSAAQADAEKLLHVTALLLPDGATSLFGGWTLADSELAFMLHRLLLNAHDVPPAIRAFAETQWQRPSVRKFVVHERPPAAAEK
jgi:glutathione S-transferase